MSGTSVLLDTNAVLYLLGGRIELESLPTGVFHISCISEMELLSYPKRALGVSIFTEADRLEELSPKFEMYRVPGNDTTVSSLRKQ